METRLFSGSSEPERRVQHARGAQCPRRSYGSGEGAYFLARLRRFGAAIGAAAAAFLRRFGAAFFAFFRAAMIHPLVDESVRDERSRVRTLSPFFYDVKSMFRVGRTDTACLVHAT
jgi:hypothetical protein